MTTATVLPPIPGERLDPPPKAPPEKVVELEREGKTAGTVLGVGYRALARFSGAKASLLAAGTTYYVFLAMFSLIALAYGLAAIFGGDRMSAYLTEAVSQAFPGLFGSGGIDAGSLQSVGRAASLVGLLTMLYAGSGAMVAAASSIHLIYGAPKDPRNFFVSRVRMLGILLILGPLIIFSFVAGTLTAQFGDRMTAALNLPGRGLLWSLAGMAVAFVVDFLIVFLILGQLGGIRPPKKARTIGAIVGAVALQLIRIPMGMILALSVDKPQYGAAAAPIGILLVLYLNSVALYAAAALTAGIAERDIPLQPAPSEPENGDPTP